MGLFDWLTGSDSSESNSTVQAITSVINDVVTKNLLSCTSVSSQSVGLNISGNKGCTIDGVSIAQVAKLNSSCVQNSKVLDSLKTDVNNAIQQSALMQQQAVLDMFKNLNSNATTEINNAVKNTFTTENVVKMISQTNQNVDLNIVDNSSTSSDKCIIRNISVQQTATLFASTIASNIVENSASLSALNDSNNSSSTTSTNPLDSIFNGINNLLSPTYLYMFLAFIFVLFVIMIGIKIIGSNRSSIMSNEATRLKTN
jgi:hypothetical protein